MPRVLGGTKTIPLCEGCHGKVHGCNWKNHGSLTRGGLQRAKAAGKRLGNPNRMSLIIAGGRGAESNRQAANTFALSMRPLIQTYQQQGLSLRAIAEELNQRNIPTSRGGRWHATYLVKIIQRLKLPRVD